MRTSPLWTCCALLVASLAASADLVISNARLIDGTGAALVEGAAEAALLGHFMQIFNRIEPAENRRWHMQQSHHCNSYAFGKAVEVAVQAMGLQRRQPSAG